MIGARGRRHEQSEPAWLTNGSAREPKLCDWVENNLEETFTFSRLPHQHHKHLQSTNMLERRKEEIKRRTLVVRRFPPAESALRLMRARVAEIHENGREAMRYLNREARTEQKKEQRRRVDHAA
jgi:transposase-like protein